MKNKISLIKNITLLLAMILIIAACGNNGEENEVEADNTGTDTEISGGEDVGEPQQGGEAIFAFQNDISNFDPIKGNSGADHPFLWPIYETLIKFNPELEPEPGLAESWDIPDDQTISLTLREGLVFHDGTPVDAEAVKYNIERINGDESNISDLQNIESVEVVDERTVNLHLSQPDASILLALSDRGGMMVSPTAVEEAGEDYSQSPVGAGPFKMVNYVPNGEIGYEAFDDYWVEGQPYLDEITVKVMSEENTRINALESGEVDFAFHITPANVDTLESNPNISLAQITPVESHIIYLNTELEPFNDKNVRQALLHGIDREALVQAITFGTGQPAYQAFPGGYWAADDEAVIEYDPEKAKELLQEAGQENLSVTINSYASAFEQRMADAIRSQLQEIGIDVTMEGMELNAANNQYFNEKEVPGLLSRWTGRPDPQMTVNNLFTSSGFYNTGGHETDELRDLIVQAGGTYDLEERAELYKEINQIAIMEETIMIPLFFELRTDAMSTSLKGFEPNLLGKPIFATTWKEQ